MKNLTIFITSAVMILALNSFADERPAKDKKPTDELRTVPIAPMATENPDEEAPSELKYLFADPRTVQVAPKVSGDPNDEAPAELKYLSAYANKP